MLTPEEKEELLESLTNLERKFIMEMLECRNQSEAIIRAGSKTKKPNVQASKIMAKGPVRKAYKAFRDDYEEDQVLSFHESCRILSQTARGNISQFISEDGTIDISKIRDPKLAESIVDSFEVEERPDGSGGIIKTYKIKLSNRTQAISTLAKLKGWDKVDISVPVTINPIYLEPLEREQSTDDSEGDDAS